MSGFTLEAHLSGGLEMATNGDPAKPVIMNEEELKRKQKEKLKKLQATGGNPRPTRSLFFFTLKNPFRKACINIVEWKYPLCPVYVKYFEYQKHR